MGSVVRCLFRGMDKGGGLPAKGGLAVPSTLADCCHKRLREHSHQILVFCLLVFIKRSSNLDFYVQLSNF